MQMICQRADDREQVKLPVDVCGLDARTPAQEGVTENISAHGARILVGKPLQVNKRLNVRSLLGSFRCRARVVYCEESSRGLYAVGVQLYAAMGQWRSPE